MKKINLEEIFTNNSDCDTEVVGNNWKIIDEPAMSKEKFLTVVKDICKQALELAAENAVAIGGGSYYNGEHLEEDPIRVVKGSILNTINQIE